MAVIGNKPATNFQSIKKQTITGNGDSSYSLDHSVSNANDLEVFVNNVRQEPTIAYSATSQTITFSEAIDSTDDVYMIYQGQTMGSVVHPADQALSATDGTFTGKVVIGSKDSGELDALSFDSADKGTMFYDQTNNVMKHWNGTKFVQMSNTFSAAGGTVTSYTSGSTTYKVHTFLSSGTFTVSAGSAQVEYLVVAGGGGGGGHMDGGWYNDPGGGGGAGGMLTGTLSVTPGSYTVTVGAGGTSRSTAVATNGGNSVFATVTATGGGGGGCGAANNDDTQRVGADGGSGGGGGGPANNTTVAPGGSGTSGQGNNGGTGGDSDPQHQIAGGGGGKSEVGENADFSADRSGTGGDGSQNNYRTGSNVYYAGGGGGGGSNQGGMSSSGQAGGNGGGGRGGDNTTTSSTAVAGTANTGGGGGGAGGNNTTGAYVSKNGGSGIVVVRYAI